METHESTFVASYLRADQFIASQRHSPLISIPLTLCFHWDSVPNPDTPCGLCVLHVFAVANTRTRPVVWWRLVNFQGGTSGPAGFPSPHSFPCPPTPARHLKMPSLRNSACEAPWAERALLLPAWFLSMKISSTLWVAAGVIPAHKVFPLTPDMGRRRVRGGNYLKSQTFLSENRESASGFV